MAAEIGFLTAAPWDAATIFFAPAPLNEAQRSAISRASCSSGYRFRLAHDAVPVEGPSLDVRVRSPEPPTAAAPAHAR